MTQYVIEPNGNAFMFGDSCITIGTPESIDTTSEFFSKKHTRHVVEIKIPTYLNAGISVLIENIFDIIKTSEIDTVIVNNFNYNHTTCTPFARSEYFSQIVDLLRKCSIEGHVHNISFEDFLRPDFLYSESDMKKIMSVLNSFPNNVCVSIVRNKML